MLYFHCSPNVLDCAESVVVVSFLLVVVDPLVAVISPALNTSKNYEDLHKHVVIDYCTALHITYQAKLIVLSQCSFHCQNSYWHGYGSG